MSVQTVTIFATLMLSVQTLLDLIHVLAMMGIKELGLLLVPSHGAHELTDENTSYPVDWAAIESGGGEEAEPEEEGPTDYGLLLANADISNGERVARRCAA